jgi:hypothetical protein
LKLSKKYKNGQNEAAGGQYYVERALAANPKSVFSTVSLGGVQIERILELCQVYISQQSSPLLSL